MKKKLCFSMQRPFKIGSSLIKVVQQLKVKNEEKREGERVRVREVECEREGRERCWGGMMIFQNVDVL